MRLSVVAYGTWGDVRPGVALGQALRQDGHQVRLIVTADFARALGDVGLEIAALPIDEHELMRRVSSKTNPLTAALAIRREIAPALLKAGRELLNVADDSDAFIANHWLMGMAGSIAQARSLGLIWMIMQPRIMTDTLPICTWPDLPDSLPLRRIYHRLSYRAAAYLQWWNYARVANHLRTSDLGLPAWSPGEYTAFLAQTPSITVISRHVLPRPADWSEHQRLTGFLYTDREDWQPPTGLMEFIESGPPPVYVGFGSMHDAQPERTTRTILRALELADQRAVLYSGWADLGRMSLPQTVFRLDFAPHGWLFPRVVAAVHHAGAGTTAAALRAGVPSVPVPHSGDQGFWARRLQRIGAGTEPLPRAALNASGLARRISIAVHDQSLRDRADQLGNRIASENGRAAAVAAILGFLRES